MISKTYLYMCVYIYIYIVGTRLVAQAQIVRDIGLVNLV